MIYAEGVDESFQQADPPRLYAAGKRFVGLYVGPGSESKQFTIARRDEIFAANLNAMILVEEAADSALQGYAKGVEHAKSVLADLNMLDVPAPCGLYCAVDFNATDAQVKGPIANYFRGFGSVFPVSRIGAYGSGATLATLRALRLITYTFQARASWAWRGNLPNPYNPANDMAGVHVVQYDNGVQLAGGEVDLCRAMQANYGQWRSGADMAVDANDVRLTDVVSILLAMCAGADSAKVHDRDGVVSLLPFWAKIANEVAKKLPVSGTVADHKHEAGSVIPPTA